MTFASPWPVVPLEQVAETALGKMLDAGRPKGAVETPYLRNLNVQWGRIDTTDVATVALSEEERARFAVHPGDLLVCEGGAIGRAAIWHGPAEIGYQKALHRIRSRGDLDLRWLRYLLEQYDNQGVLAARATGSTIKHLPQTQLRQLPVPLPELSEQRRIVDIVEDHLSRLDAAEVALRTGSLRLGSLMQSALSTAYRHGDLRDLGSVASIQGGIQKQPKRVPASNAYPFLRVANVTKHGLDLAQVHQVELFGSELERLRLEPGDLLVVEGNGSASQIGRAAVWTGAIENCVHQNHLIRVRPAPGLHPDFLEAVWNSPQHRAVLSEVASSTSGLHTLSVAKLKQLRIPLPSWDSQVATVEAVTALRTSRKRLDDQLTQASQRAAALRRSLLAAAFSGQL